MSELNLTTEKSNIQYLEKKIKWHNSANVLCHYMREMDYLVKKIKDKAIVPRYVIEPIDYIGMPSFKKVMFPMVCFCDIPFSRVSTHWEKYGPYGIAFEKRTFSTRYKLQPIQYVSETSPLLHDYREAFLQAIDNDIGEAERPLKDYLVGALTYMKPVEDFDIDISNESHIIYQDECEWRFIPQNRIDDLSFMYINEQVSEYARDVYSEVLEDHKETWLSFEWEEIRYILVKENEDVRTMIQCIRELDYEDSIKDMLISKIQVVHYLLGDV